VLLKFRADSGDYPLITVSGRTSSGRISVQRTELASCPDRCRDGEPGDEEQDGVDEVDAEGDPPDDRRAGEERRGDELQDEGESELSADRIVSHGDDPAADAVRGTQEGR
jgi:hypothetical protein